MKRILSIILMALFLSVGATTPNASAADATLRVTNPNKDTIRVAVHYYDTKKNNWRTLGWYDVEPNSTSGNITVYNIGSEIFLHAEMGKSKWGKGDAVRDVIDIEFDYYGDSSNCSKGRGRHSAKFSRYPVKNGVVNYKPTASK